MMTLAELRARFADEQTCREHLQALRWPDGKVHCPKCGLSLKVYKTNRPWRWVCKSCAKNGYGFSPSTGTVFETTKYPLPTCFQVLSLMLQTRKCSSAVQFH